MHIKNKRKLISWFVFITVIIVVTVWIVFSRNDSVYSEKKSESYMIMNFFSDMRSFPNESNAEQKYYQAFMNKNLSPLETDNYSVWTNIGPTNVGGRTLCTAINPFDTSIIWLGAASGGLWKSTSGGIGSNVFTNIQTGFPVLAVSSIVIDSNDVNIMYIGTGETYGYQQAENGLGIRQTRGSYGIGILKTTNGGLNWTKSLDWTSNQSRGIWDILYNPLNHNIIYAATTEGVYKSFDAGDNWVQVYAAQMVTDLEINRIDTNTIFAGIGNLSSPSPGLYRSTDSGLNWTKLTEGLPGSANDGRITVSSYYSNPSIIFSVFGNRNSTVGVYRSDDNGNNWVQTSGVSPDFLDDQGWYANGIKVKDTDSSKLLFSGVGFYKSTNYGADLVKKSSNTSGDPNYIHVDHHDIISNPKNHDKLYISTDGGLYRSNDFGETFFRCQSGYVTTQFYSTLANSKTDSVMILGGVQDNGVVRFGGTTNWYRSASGDGMMCYINPLNNNSVIACNQYLEISKSYSRGDQNTWTIVYPASSSTVANFVAPLASCPSDTSVFYGGKKLIVKSTDGGTNWFDASAELDGNKILSIAVSHNSTDTLYAATVPTGTQMGFFRSTNGGTNWTNISSGLPNRYPTDIEVNPEYSPELFAVFGGFGTSHIFRSTNGGSNWTDINNGLPDIPFHTVAIDPLYTDNIYAGTDLGIYVSTNSGDNWYSFSEGLPEAVMVFDLAVSYANRSLRAATHGRGVFERYLVNDNPLPVEMTSMSATSKANNVYLKWTTANEQNNKEFHIERSNGSEYESVGKISGAGNKDTPTDYNYTDKNLSTGEYRYRIRQVDCNGNFKYFKFNNPVQIGSPDSYNLEQNFPNPFNNTTVFKFRLPVTSSVKINVYDITGKEMKVLVNNNEAEPGYHSVVFDGSSFASGI